MPAAERGIVRRLVEDLQPIRTVAETHVLYSKAGEILSKLADCGLFLIQAFRLGLSKKKPPTAETRQHLPFPVYPGIRNGRTLKASRQTNVVRRGLDGTSFCGRAQVWAFRCRTCKDMSKACDSTSEPWVLDKNQGRSNYVAGAAAKTEGFSAAVSGADKAVC